MAGYRRYIEFADDGRMTGIYEMWVEDTKVLNDMEVEIDLKYKDKHEFLIRNHKNIISIYKYDKTDGKIKKKSLTEANAYKLDKSKFKDKEITQSDLDEYEDLPDDFILFDNVDKLKLK